MTADGTYTFNKKTTHPALVLTNLGGDPVEFGEIARDGNRLKFSRPSDRLVEDIMFPPGTRLLFDQDTVPIGWNKDVDGSINDRVVRIITTARVPNGGSWTISGLSDNGHIHALGAHVHVAPNHQHALGNHVHGMNNHVHQEIGVLNGAAGGASFGAVTNGEYTTGPDPSYTEGPSGPSDFASGGITSGPSTTSDFGFASPRSDGSWRPAHRDVIVGIKV